MSGVTRSIRKEMRNSGSCSKVTRVEGHSTLDTKLERLSTPPPEQL